MKTTKFRVFNAVLVVALALSLVAFVQPVQAVSIDIVISQVYGAGGNSGATYNKDYVELFNRGTSTVNLAGLSLQYASATGNFNSAFALSGSVAPGQYYLVAMAAGTNGAVLPVTPDLDGTLALGATAGKVILANSTAVLTTCGATGNPCSTSLYVDLVGYGTTTTVFEGSGPTPAPSATNAVFRNNRGCTDTDNNNADFTAAAPGPNNTASSFHYCTGPTNPSGVGAATPTTLFAGDATLLTVAVMLGTNPTSTGLTITCDLSSIGESATQPFFDDGTNGDVTAGDNTFSFQATVDSSTGVGVKSLPCAVTDAQSRSGSASISLTVQAATPSPGSVVVSQVYGGGGNSGATYKNDFIELYNRGSADVAITGWSVQYTSASGSTWQVTALSGVMKPGRYYLVQEAAGAGGTINLPTPDATGSIAMGSGAGKVALVNNSTALAVSCPAGLVDFVGYGSANCSETSPTAALSNTTAALRMSNGGQDTDNNSADFTVGAPNPRNSSFPFTAGGLATPNTLFAGNSVLLTVAVTPDINPPGTGLAVTCDLSSIGGPAARAFYDDGTNGDAVAGDNTFSFSAAVDAGTTDGAKSLACTASDAQFRSISVSIRLSVTAILPIGTVNGPVLDTDNGTAHNAAKMGQVVAIQGVIYEKTLQAISNSTNTYKGFFIQNTAATADTDPNTSDGLFVFMVTNSTISGPGGSTYTPTVGDEVILSATVTEYYSMTELQAPLTLVKLVRSGVDIEAEVPPVVADPPVSLANANRYWERLQGMRMQVPQNSIVLGGRNVFSPADAEIWVARPDSTIALRANPYARKAFRDAHPLDDNYNATNWDGNGYRILMGSLGIKALAGDAQTLIDPAHTFDTVTNAPAGGLNYTFSKYRIEISEQPTFNEGVDPAANNPPTAFDRSIHYTIADYNLENLYDYRDNPFSGCDFANIPTGSNAGCPLVAPFLSAVTPPYDYVPASDAAYQARLNDIANQIINDLHSPDILMVQEVENQDICTVAGGALICGTTDNADGKPDVLQELALKIASLGGPAYDAAFDRDSSDLRGIAPAFVYRTDRVELLPAAGDPVLGGLPAIVYAGAAVPLDSDVSNPKTLNAVLPAGVTACDTSWVFPRAPSIGLFRTYSTGIGVGSHRDVYVINNHFKSGPDTCVGHRTEQAKYNAAIVAFLQAANPNARIVLGGDLNVYPRPDDIAYGASDQLGSLYAPSLGLTNLWDVLLGQAPESAYSYVYLGMAQTLDQMFVNQPLLADLQQFRIAHINSDFPADYSGDVARGTSDHDPNVATIVINDPPTVDASGPYAVNEGSSVTLTATDTDPEGQPLTYAWDLDNDGSFETPGQSATFSAASLDGPSSYTVQVKATDPGGLSAEGTGTVDVVNVAPTVNTPAVSSEPSTEGQSVTASATFTDPGVNDTLFTCTVNYGDGSGNLPGTVNGNTCTGPAHVYPTFGTYTVAISVTDKDGGTGSNTATHIVIFNWTGFFSPVDNLPAWNSAKAGSAIPVKFSLGGNKGLNIFAAGYPQSVQIACDTGAVLDSPQATANPGGSSLTYSNGGQYNYGWKTEKAWAGTCRQLIVTLIDGTTHTANFKFK